MKTNGQMNGGGKLRAEYRQAWARYYVRHIQEYARSGIPIWGLTVQNDPEAAQTWDSCLYTGEEERDFVRDHLGPALRDAGLDQVKVIIWDHNRDRLYERAKVVLDDPQAARFVWGVGSHWYCGDHFDNVQLVHEAYPDKHLVFTEGCREDGPHLGSWDTGERYARSIIEDLNRSAQDRRAAGGGRGSPARNQDLPGRGAAVTPRAARVDWRAIAGAGRPSRPRHEIDRP